MHARMHLAVPVAVLAGFLRVEHAHAQSANAGFHSQGVIKHGARSLGLIGPMPPRVHKRVEQAGASGPGFHAAYNPLISFGADAGIAAFSQGISQAAFPGPAWGVRIGLEVIPFLSVEARYFGSYHPTRDNIAGPGIGLLTQGTAATIRLTWRGLPYVQPYVFGGAGVYFLSVVGSGADSQATPLHSSPSLALPVGLGLDVPINRHFTIGGEATYHALVRENLASVDTLRNGDLWSATTVVRFTP